jgi:hypothetical protein
MRAHTNNTDMKKQALRLVQDVVADAMPALVERVKAAHVQYTRIPGTPRTLPQTDPLPEQDDSPPAAAASSSAASVDPPTRVSPGRQSADTAVDKLQQEVSGDTYEAHVVIWSDRVHGSMLRLSRRQRSAGLGCDMRVFAHSE